MIAGIHLSPTRTRPTRVPYLAVGSSISIVFCRDVANVLKTWTALLTSIAMGSPADIMATAPTQFTVSPRLGTRSFR